METERRMDEIIMEDENRNQIWTCLLSFVHACNPVSCIYY